MVGVVLYFWVSVFVFVIEVKVVVLVVVIVVDCEGGVVVGLNHIYCSTVKHCLVVLYIFHCL